MGTILRYTQWDGTQQLKLDADKVFEKLAEYLSYTDDIRQAMDWMMRQGMDFDGMRVMGLDEFIEQLRQEMRERYREVNLKNALSEMEQKLEDVLNQERKTLDSLKGKKPGVEDKNRELSKMPRKLSEAIRKLESYDFEDAEAKEAFDELLEEYENIRDLENFKDRNQHLFHGPKSLKYQEALDLMKEMERMRQLEQDLMSGNFDTISMEDLQQMLGQQAMQDFKNLKQVMVLLNNSGYLMPKGEHSQLSPKGVRRIGQLALRDIFQSLLKDRAGSHTTDHRGVTEIRPDETKTYAFGDPLNLNLVGTLKKALARKPGVPLQLNPEDFEIYENDYGSSSSTVLCLDMSWSMVIAWTYPSTKADRRRSRWMAGRSGTSGAPRTRRSQVRTCQWFVRVVRPGTPFAPARATPPVLRTSSYSLETRISQYSSWSLSVSPRPITSASLRRTTGTTRNPADINFSLADGQPVLKLPNPRSAEHQTGDPCTRTSTRYWLASSKQRNSSPL